MLGSANDDDLEAIAGHRGIDVSSPTAGVDPPFWEDSNLRVFISHLSAHREFAAQLQEQMREFGLTGFVAHDDIEPTTEWQGEIETALETCEVLVALLHEGFASSNWTDQEVGFAMGRGLPVFAIRFDATPHGFIGKFQAFNGNGKTARDIAKELFDTLRKHKQTQRRMGEILIYRLEKSGSFLDAKSNIELVEEMEAWHPGFSDRISKAADSNTQIMGAWGVPERVKSVIEKWAAKDV